MLNLLRILYIIERKATREMMEVTILQNHNAVCFIKYDVPLFVKKTYY